MSTDRNKTFGKKEHLCKLTLIEQLFGGGAKAMTAWPMRMVFLLVDKKDEQAPSVQVLISVSKRYFKHAVKRNRVKRQIREAFRYQKQELETCMQNYVGKELLVAFVWQTEQLQPSKLVSTKMTKLLDRLVDNIKEMQSETVMKESSL